MIEVRGLNDLMTENDLFALDKIGQMFADIGLYEIKGWLEKR